MINLVTMNMIGNDGIALNMIGLNQNILSIGKRNGKVHLIPLYKVDCIIIRPWP